MRKLGINLVIASSFFTLTTNANSPETVRIKVMYTKGGVQSSENPKHQVGISEALVKNSCFNAIVEKLKTTPVPEEKCDGGTPIWQLTLFAPKRSAKTFSYKVSTICDDGKLQTRDAWLKWVDEKTVIEQSGGNLADAAKASDSEYLEKFCSADAVIQAYKTGAVEESASPNKPATVVSDSTQPKAETKKTTPEKPGVQLKNENDFTKTAIDPNILNVTN